MMQPVFAQDDVCENTNRGDSTRDIDADDDGLIEICYLEDLNAIRYQLDGSGYKTNTTATKITNGCAEGGAAVCIGYELMRDLNFATTQSYVNAASNRAAWTVDNFSNASDDGWDPIGMLSSNDCSHMNSNCFSSIFEGNGKRISNLQINRDNGSSVGLFSGNSGSIRNIGLSELRVESGFDSGGMVAYNEGMIINSDVGGQLRMAGLSVGVLVGYNDTRGIIINSHARGSIFNNNNDNTGGLIGFNLGRIINSYATIATSGSPRAEGGLVGRMTRGSIVNSYATGEILALSTSNEIGGLVGRITAGQVINSYSIGAVRRSSGTHIGGLIGRSEGSISDSYWNTNTSDQTSSAGGTGRTTAQLRSPTMATGIYANWSANDWDFGNMQSYPALRYNEVDGVDGVDACDSDPDTALPRCGTLLPGQPGRDSGLSALFFRTSETELNTAEVFVNQPFSSQISDYGITIPPVATFQIEPYAINDAASISIMKEGDNTNYFNRKSSGDTSDPIVLATDGTANIIKVVVADASPTTYTFTISGGVPFSITNADGSEVDEVNEGEEITLTAAFGDSRILRYSWQQEKLLARTTEASSMPTLILRIPGDFITGSDATTQDIAFRLEAALNDGTRSISTKTVTIMKVNNGDPNFMPAVTPSRISVVTEDPDGEGMAEYAWEQRGIGDAGWTLINGATRNTYSVPSQAAVTTYYRVRVSNYTDAQGYRFTDSVNLGPLRTDIDDDDDGLIDIYYLEDLDKVRHQLDGSGYKESDTATGITAGCPAEGCKGYELRRDLDFEADDSYVSTANKVVWTVDNFEIDDGTDAGWDPIGSLNSRSCNDANNNCFSSIFEGNGNRISNLQINRDSADYVGLFAGNSGLVRNIGLARPEIEGERIIGALVGFSRGTAARQATIINSNVVGGSVKGSNDNIGGLVGINQADSIIVNSYANINVEGNFWTGGLVGTNRGRITNSYATGTVDGGNDNDTGTGQTIGGLVGQSGREEGSEAAIIENCYALGNVSSDGGDAEIGVAGLVGYTWRKSNISDSYATGNVKVSGNTAGIDTFGGLVGYIEDQKQPNNVSTVENSYWDEETSGQSSSSGGKKRNTAQLQSPTAARGIYKNWQSADWDFGTRQTYPVLRYNEFAGVDACDSDPDTALPRCGTLLPGQSGRGSGLSALFFRVNDIDLNIVEVFADSPFYALAYNIIIPAATFQIEPYAVNDAAGISVMKEGDNTNYFASKSSGDRSDAIILATDGTANILKIVVADASPTTYTFTIRAEVPFSITGADGAEIDKVNEGEEITLTAKFRDIGNDMYSWQQDDLGIATAARPMPTLTLRIPEDFIKDSGTTMQRIAFALNTGDISTTKILPIIKVPNGVPIFTPIVTTSTISIAIEEDPDGEGSVSYVWQRRSQGDPSWQVISGVTGNTYDFPSQDTGNTRYRVLVSYTDAQGYPPVRDILGPFSLGSVMIRAKIFLEGPLR